MGGTIDTTNNLTKLATFSADDQKFLKLAGNIADENMTRNLFRQGTRGPAGELMDRLRNGGEDPLVPHLAESVALDGLRQKIIDGDSKLDEGEMRALSQQAKKVACTAVSAFGLKDEDGYCKP